VAVHSAVVAGSSVAKRSGIYVESDCCTSCGIPWELAPEVFSEGEQSCVVRRQPETLTELRRTLRVLRTQDLGCVRYGGSDARVLRILTRAGCANTCDQRAAPAGSAPTTPEPGARTIHKAVAIALIAVSVVIALELLLYFVRR
jgi:hypothetical protein